MWIVPGNSHGVHLSHTEDDDAIRVYPVTNHQCVLFIVDTIKSSVNRSRPGLRRRPRQTSRCVHVNDHDPDQQAPGKGIDYFCSSVQKPRAPKLRVSPIGVYHLIDTRFSSHSSRYVKSFVEDAGAALLRPDLPAPSCGCYLRRRSARRPPNGTRHHDFRQRPADGCHGWYRAPASQPLTTPGPSHISNIVRRRRVIRPASRCLLWTSRGRMPCWKDADEPA